MFSIFTVSFSITPNVLGLGEVADLERNI